MLRRLGDAPMPMGAMRGLPRGDARRSNGDAVRGGEGSSDGADVVDAETGADVNVEFEVGESVRVGATSSAIAKASFSACPIPSGWPPSPNSFFPFTRMLSPSVVAVSSASLARGAPGECGAGCCGDIVLAVVCCGCSAKGCGTVRMSRQANEVAQASWAGAEGLSLEVRAWLCAAINAVTAVELFSKADALPRMLQMWVRAGGPWKRLRAAKLGCGRLQTE